MQAKQARQHHRGEQSVRQTPTIRVGERRGGANIRLGSTPRTLNLSQGRKHVVAHQRVLHKTRRHDEAHRSTQAELGEENTTVPQNNQGHPQSRQTAQQPIDANRGSRVVVVQGVNAGTENIYKA